MIAYMRAASSTVTNNFDVKICIRSVILCQSISPMRSVTSPRRTFLYVRKFLRQTSINLFLRVRACFCISQSNEVARLFFVTTQLLEFHARDVTINDLVHVSFNRSFVKLAIACYIANASRDICIHAEIRNCVCHETRILFSNT